jgi:hypothetical protein
VEPLVRLTEDGERVVLRLEGHEVDEVERRLLSALGAVLDLVGRVEEEAERRVVPARHPRLDPVEHAHVVELARGGGEVVEGGGKRCRRFVGGDRLEHRRKVDGGLRLGIEMALEEVCVLGPKRLRGNEVIELEIEAVHQLADVAVASVDELAAPLGHLVVGPGGGIGEHAPAGAAGSFVDSGGDSAVGQAHVRPAIPAPTMTILGSSRPARAMGGRARNARPRRSSDEQLASSNTA